MHKIRVMSYNIHGSRDDLRALAAVVRAEAPDLVVVQEAPRRFRWRARNARLAREWGMLYADGGLWSIGNAVFTSLRISVRESWCARYPLTPGRQMRGMVFTRCTIGRTPFAVVGTHLSLDAAERAAQAQLLKAQLAELDEPVIVCGDINEVSSGAAWRGLADGLIDTGQACSRDDVFTFSCASPRRRIDAILVDPRWEVLDYRVVDTPLARAASDHFPIVTDIALPA